jgi:hypothetical protein
MLVDTNKNMRDVLFPKRSYSNGVDHDLWQLEFANSHKMSQYEFGTIPIVFEFTVLFKPKNCVIIGSGTGIIPRTIREAQIKSGINGTTCLIDKGDGWGALPNEIHNKNSVFRQSYPEIEVIKSDSLSVGTQWINEKRNIDLLFIDGDHSYEGSKSDFNVYSQMVSSCGLIFMHDTNGFHGELDLTIKYIKSLNKYEVLNLVNCGNNDFGGGLAIIKKS